MPAHMHAGIIYFIDPDAPTEDQAIVFSFQAHASTITAVRAVRTGTKPHSTYLVISADVVNSVRVHNVDPFVAKTATRETDYVTHCAPTQVSLDASGCMRGWVRLRPRFAHAADFLF